MASAKDVVVVTIRRARCLLCEWAGGEHDNYQDANAERLGHLKAHNTAGQEGDADG